MNLKNREVKLTIYIDVLFWMRQKRWFLFAIAYGLVMHFGSNSRDKLKRQEFPDHLEATPLELPDDDDDTPSEKRRKLRLKIRNVEKMLKK